VAALLSMGSAGCSLLLGISADDYAVAKLDGAVANDRDGSREGGPEAAAPSLLCHDGAPHLLCEDFDTDTSLETRGWPTPLTTGGGKVVIDSADYRSFPHSVAMSNDVANARASIDRSFNGVDPAGDLHFSFAVRVQNAKAVIIAIIDIGLYSLRFGITSEGAYNVDEWDNTGGQAEIAHAIAATTSDAWVNVEMIVHFVQDRQQGSSVAISMDGRSVLNPVAIKPTVDTGTPRIELGILDRPGTSNQLRFDNVVFDGP